jgi:hypothetical protein
LCVYLNDIGGERKGQIAHLNKNPKDSSFNNLVWLCLDHHDEFDGRTSQSKGYTPKEVRQYRDQLYRRTERYLQATFDGESDVKFVELKPLPEATVYERLKDEFRKELGFIDKPWRFNLWQVADQPELFAYKSSNGSDGVCLVERIDLPDGRIIVACIQIVGNPGRSITNSVEELCFQVCERFEIPPERLVWLAHYDNYPHDDWTLVRFDDMPPDKPFGKPTWTSVTQEMWRNLRLRPKKRLTHRHGSYVSKLRKLFDWPKHGIVDS